MAAYLINKTPTKILHGKAPYEMLFKAMPSYNHIKVFGCLCYAHNLQRQKTSLGQGIGSVYSLDILMER